MYRITVNVVEWMDLYDVHCTLWETSMETGTTERISTSHATVSGDPWGNSDPFASIISALREWANMTISS
jgi:hypothetical protein